MLTGAIIGAIIGVLVVVFTFFAKEQRFNKVLRTITDPGLEYSAMYHHASANRYKKGFKYFDSYGALYLIGKNVYYKKSETETPLQFNLNECTVQAEPDWRLLKWFSITTPGGEKHYFNSSKMGALKNNSDETLVSLKKLKDKKAS